MTEAMKCSECGGTEFRFYEVEALRRTIDTQVPDDVSYHESDGDGLVNQVTCQKCESDMTDEEVMRFCELYDLSPFYRGYIGSLDLDEPRKVRLSG